MLLPNHGANPSILLKHLGKEQTDSVIDFSENTNPFGPPAFIKDLNSDQLVSSIKAYPDPNVTDLTERLAFTNKVPKETILVGNGAAELIYLIAQLFENKHVAIVEPAFSEYREACEAFGCDITSIVLPPPWKLDVEKVTSTFSKIEALFICSPNNPTGVQYTEKEIIFLLEEAEKAGVYIILDEAFYDFSEEGVGLARLQRNFSRFIILRSLTKMFAIAGIRLGYLIADKNIIKKVSRYQPTWSVNGIAQHIGLKLLDERSFVTNTVENIHIERRRMTQLLQELDYIVSDSSVNFYLLGEETRIDLMPLFMFLVDKGIIARHTYNFSGLNGAYLRFAVKDRLSNNHLLAALSEWRKR